LIQPCHMLQLELKGFVAHADPHSRLASVSRIHFLRCHQMHQCLVSSCVKHRGWSRQ
jgi:hypothetical protein